MVDDLEWLILVVDCLLGTREWLAIHGSLTSTRLLDRPSHSAETPNLTPPQPTKLDPFTELVLEANLNWLEITLYFVYHLIHIQLHELDNSFLVLIDIFGGSHSQSEKISDTSSSIPEV